MSESVPDSFDEQQPDLPTLAVDPDPDDVDERPQPTGTERLRDDASRP